MEDRIDHKRKECERDLTREEPDESHGWKDGTLIPFFYNDVSEVDEPKYCTFSSPIRAIGPPC